MFRDFASMVIASISPFMANWSTPTILFCFLNFIIAVIFLVSNSKSLNHDHNNSPSQLVRSPSLLQRVKSVNLSSFYGSMDSEDHYGGHYDNSVSQLSRRSSLLQRVKSFDFSFSSFYTNPQDELHDSYGHESEVTRYDSPSQLARVPSLMERVKSIKFSSYNPFPTESVQLGDSTGEPARVPSLMDRVKSFRLTSPVESDRHLDDTFSSQDQASDIDQEPRHDVVQEQGSSMVQRSKSENSSKTPMKNSMRNLTKSRSEKRIVESDDNEEDVDQRRPSTMKEATRDHNECVDTKADDFIKRFKQQLKLQRIDSLQRFREMLNRGT